jgi:hypothetical protein
MPRRLLLAHCLSSYFIFVAITAAAWARGDPPFNLRAATMIAAAPVAVPLLCTLGLWNSYGIRWDNAGLAFAHVIVTAACYLAIGQVRASRKQRPPGLCRVCGYDLRASPGRCPECGTESNRSSESAEFKLTHYRPGGPL